MAIVVRSFPWLVALLVQPLVASACAHQTVGRPPDAREITEINAAAAGSPMRVEYVKPLTACWTIGCVGPVGDVARIEASDPQVTTFQTTTGELRTLPTAAVAGVSFNDSSPAAGMGAAVGAMLGLAVGTFGYFITGGLPDHSDRPNDRSFRSAAPTVIGFAAVFALVGVGIGAATGGRRSVSFGSSP